MIEITGKCIVRTYSAGVFFGTVKKREGKEILLENARRIWYWNGAASLSELAEKGTSKPKKCKIPCPVSVVLLTEVIEVIPCATQAIRSIEGVPIWTVRSGDGSRDGSGDGDGSGSGDGFGDGSGFGFGDGDGSGSGSGFGDGDGSGFGFGDGDG